jgi:hypothetical protein
MKRLSFRPILALCVTMTAPGACKKEGETSEPSAEDEGKGDALTQLKAIPAEVQAEVDLVLKPLDDAKALMVAIETAPERPKISLPELKAMLKASYDADVKAGPDGVQADVTVDLSKLDVTAEATAMGAKLVASFAGGASAGEKAGD